jgi:hypothetical protein
MRFETRSLTDGKCLFESIDRDLETAIKNSRNTARLYSIDPESIETVVSSSKAAVSKDLSRYGVEWHVNSADYAEAPNSGLRA